MEIQTLLSNAIGLYEQIDVPSLILNERFELVWLSECAERNYPQYKLKNGFLSVLSESRRIAAREMLSQNKVHSFSVEEVSDAYYNCTMTPLMSEGELGYVIVQLSQASDYMTSDNKDVTRLVAVFSKRVREPLFYIFSALATIGHRFESAEDYASLDYVKAIQKNAYSILRTVAHTSDYMKDVNGFPSHNPIAVPFTGYIKDLYATAESVTRGTGIPLILDVEDNGEGLLVMVDESRLSEAILNILLNSFLYTREGNRISISLRYVNNNAVLRFTDRGMGISPEYLGKVFDSHFSYEAGNTPLSNMGLGLTLARNIILRHGGTIAIDSKEHEGTNVTIRLPVLQPQDVPELFHSPTTLNLRNRFSPVYVELAEISNTQIV